MLRVNILPSALFSYRLSRPSKTTPCWQQSWALQSIQSSSVSCRLNSEQDFGLSSYESRHGIGYAEDLAMSLRQALVSALVIWIYLGDLASEIAKVAMETKWRQKHWCEFIRNSLWTVDAWTVYMYKIKPTSVRQARRGPISANLGRGGGDCLSSYRQLRQCEKRLCNCKFTIIIQATLLNRGWTEAKPRVRKANCDVTFVRFYMLPTILLTLAYIHRAIDKFEYMPLLFTFTKAYGRKNKGKTCEVVLQ